MRRLLVLSLMLAASGCGLLRESEPRARTVTLEVKASDCAIAPVEELTAVATITVSKVSETVACLDAQLEDAFKQVKGAVAGEISLDELRTLHEKGILTAPLETEHHWIALGAALSALHPEGRPALLRSHLERVVGWLRAHGELYVRTLRASENHGFSLELVQEIAGAVEELEELLSPAAFLTEGQAQSIARVALSPKPKDLAELERKVRAAWTLKDLLLSKGAGAQPAGAGERPLAIEGLKRLLRFAVSVARAVPETIRWGISESSTDVPAALPQEFRAAVSLLNRYLSEAGFRAIDLDPMEWAVRVLSPEASTDLVPDLLRIGRRLAPELSADGFHPAMLIPLAREFPGFAEDLVASASAFTETDEFDRPYVTTRDILHHPVLERVALKGRFRIYLEEGERLPKRLDYPLSWNTAFSRLSERRMILRLFTAFDRDGDGKIPLNGSNSQETREALDLAFTFLRFLTPRGKDEKEDHLPEPVIVRPGSLYRTIGLIGDAWMPDGNKDGSLNGEELYSVIAIYNEIQQTTQYAFYGMEWIQHYAPAPGMELWDIPGGPYYSRKDFVRLAAGGLVEELPHLGTALAFLGDAQTESLTHALVGIPDTPVQVYPIDYSSDGDVALPTPVTLTQWVRQDAMLAPAAIFTLVDRLMLRCDANEDESLSWVELDCAMPLLVRASYETVSSELVELDPLVHDGSALALQFLQQPGVPSTLAKLLAVNGSLREVHLTPEDMTEMVSGLRVTWLDIARFLGARPGVNPAPWVLEARKRYKVCDADGSEDLAGAELECFAEISLERLLDAVESGGLSLAAVGSVDDLLKLVGGKEMVLAAFKLALTDRMPERFTSDPGRLLRLIESAIRRGRPLCTLPGC